MPKTKKSPRFNGDLEIEIISNDDASRLLGKVRRMGIYSRYAANIIETCKRLQDSQHAKFRVPSVPGREQRSVGTAIMSRLNQELRGAKLSHRLRYVADENVCVTEPYKW